MESPVSEKESPEVFCVIDGSYGVYVPQVFAERFPERVTDPEDKKILLAGPDDKNEFYFETWEKVLNENPQFLLGESGDVFFSESGEFPGFDGFDLPEEGPRL